MGILSDLFSPSKNAIFVRTDKPRYFAGERVTGTISLSITEPLQVDGIYLKVKGFQQVHFTKQVARSVYDANAPGKHRTVYDTVVCQEKQVFLRRMFCIYSVKSTLMPANFIFPFEFVLDHGLPGTFSFNTDSRTLFARSVYKVKAEVVVPGMFKFNLKHNQEIIVNEPFQQKIRRTEAFKEENVTFCCCISQGHVSMAASIDKNAYAPGEQCLLTLTVDSQDCKVDIDRITFSLTQSLILRAGNSTHSDTFTLIRNTAPRVRAGTSTTRTIPLTLPTNCYASCSSSLISSQYSLRVQLEVPWCSDVILSVPVQIYAPVSEDYVSTVKYPETWAAQTMPIVHLSMNSGQRY